MASPIFPMANSLCLSHCRAKWPMLRVTRTARRLWPCSKPQTSDRTPLASILRIAAAAPCNIGRMSLIALGSVSWSSRRLEAKGSILKWTHWSPVSRAHVAVRPLPPAKRKKACCSASIATRAMRLSILLNVLSRCRKSLPGLMICAKWAH